MITFEGLIEPTIDLSFGSVTLIISLLFKIFSATVSIISSLETSNVSEAFGYYQPKSCSRTQCRGLKLKQRQQNGFNVVRAPGAR